MVSTASTQLTVGLLLFSIEELTGKVNLRSDNLCGPVHFPALIPLQFCIWGKGLKSLRKALTKSPEEREGSGSTTRQLAEQ